MANGLKEKQGKPKIAGRNRKEEEKTSTDKNHSSEKGRKQKQNRKPKSNKFSNRPDLKPQIEVLNIAAHKKLPANAVFQGYRTSRYHGFQMELDLKYRQKVYYSRSTREYYVSNLLTYCPSKGDYTYNLQKQVYRLKYKYSMTIGSILQLLEGGGVDITKDTLSNILLWIGEILSPE